MIQLGLTRPQPQGLAVSSDSEWGSDGQGERLVFKKFVGSIESVGIFCFDDDGSERCACLC